MFATCLWKDFLTSVSVAATLSELFGEPCANLCYFSEVQRRYWLTCSRYLDFAPSRCGDGSIENLFTIFLKLSVMNEIRNFLQEESTSPVKDNLDSVEHSMTANNCPFSRPLQGHCEAEQDHFFQSRLRSLYYHTGTHYPPRSGFDGKSCVE